MESTVVKGRSAARNASRLTGRDYVVVAIFGVLLFAVFMAFSLVFSVSANSAWFTHSVAALPAGIVWMYVLAKVPKRGAIAIMCALVALLGLVMGMLWTGPLGIALGGVLAELIVGAPEKRTTLRRVAAYVAFVLCFWAGQISLIFFAGQSYVDMCVAMGVTAEYGQQLVNFVHGPLCIAALVATIAGSIVGGLFGTRMFKKHFARMSS